jgi:hypothetical protein
MLGLAVLSGSSWNEAKGRETMKRKMTGAAGLVGAFVGGIVVANLLGWGLTTARAKTVGAAAQGQDITVQRLISPTVTDEDIALLRKNLRE